MTKERTERIHLPKNAVWLLTVRNFWVTTSFAMIIINAGGRMLEEANWVRHLSFAKISLLSLCIATVLAIVHFFFSKKSCRVELAADHLVVETGRRRESIPYLRIRDVTTKQGFPAKPSSTCDVVIRSASDTPIVVPALAEADAHALLGTLSRLARLGGAGRPATPSERVPSA